MHKHVLFKSINNFVLVLFMASGIPDVLLFEDVELVVVRALACRSELEIHNKVQSSKSEGFEVFKARGISRCVSPVSVNKLLRSAMIVHFNSSPVFPCTSPLVVVVLNLEFNFWSCHS